MNNLQTFNFNNQPVRTIQLNNQPYFNLKDVCTILDIGNPSQLKTRLKQEGVITNEVGVKTGLKTDGTPAIQKVKMTYINESNLYKTIFQSRKEEAEQFTEWVTSEVLPAIRKNGAYLTDEKAYDITHNPQSLADLLLQAGEQLKQKEIIIQEMKPKALFADAVASSKTSILIGQLAKILTQNGYQIGQNRLFEKLRSEGFLSSRKGADWNMPQQRYVEQGIFEIKESTHIDGNGVNITTKTVKVTGKGQQYFINKFLGS
jgi:phage antirepressor protein